MTPPTDAQWRLATPDDLGAVLRIQAIVHPALQERAAVLADKLRACPGACRIWMHAGAPGGYALGHPWPLGEVPELDARLPALGGAPDCLFIHDVAVLPQARGEGAAGRHVADMAHFAARLGLTALALVSVYGTVPLWRRHGFGERPDAVAAEALRPYGPTARYMVRPLP